MPNQLSTSFTPFTNFWSKKYMSWPEFFKNFGYSCKVICGVGHVDNSWWRSRQGPIRLRIWLTSFHLFLSFWQKQLKSQWRSIGLAQKQARFGLSRVSNLYLHCLVVDFLFRKPLDFENFNLEVWHFVTRGGLNMPLNPDVNTEIVSDNLTDVNQLIKVKQRWPMCWYITTHCLKAWSGKMCISKW